MSIRHFSNQHCPICNQDTLHKACVCTVCGHIKETPTEARNRVRKRLFVKYRKVYGPACEYVLHRQATKNKPATEPPKDWSPTATTGTKFGRGRQRTKA